MKKIIGAAVFAAVVVPVKAATEQAKLDTMSVQQISEVVVKAVRAPKNAPFAVANIEKNDLQTFSQSGKELPFLFARTPGVLAWSENGMGAGPAYMRMRGAADSRINVTLDGVPLNSPEDQSVFWANMNSYGALLSSAQIQRGVGSSTNGDGAFGGSISLATLTPQTTPSLELTGSYGSLNTMNVGMNFSTGLLWNHLIFDGAYHETNTDGYIHNTDGRSGSYYGSLTWLGDNFTLRYRNVGNFEKMGQAWSGVTTGNDDATIYGNGVNSYKDMYDKGLGKFNPLTEYLVFDDDSYEFVKDANGNYQTKRYTMRDGGYWDKTTDNFYQNHNILSASWQPASHWTHNVTLHYTYGYGYYNELKPDAKLAPKFGINETYMKGDELKYTKSDVVRQKGLTQNAYGAIYNVNYKDNSWDVIGGLNMQQFRCNHWGYVTYIADEAIERKYLVNGQKYKYYDSDADKNDYSAFVKADYRFADHWNLFTDLQMRYVNYHTDGINDRFISDADGKYTNHRININENYFFVNPKAGISFTDNGHKAYASIAYSNREPERNNFTDNGNYPMPSPERLLDLELGYQYKGKNWYAGANLYYMGYINQFVQTGLKSDIGENLTTNVRSSYRLGAELSAGWSPFSFLSFEGNAALSSNKIKDFDEYIENWEGDAVRVHYDNSTLAYSPAAILNGFVDLHFCGFNATWHTNYVGRQYLDNTECKNRSLDAFSQTDINVSYTINAKRILGLKQIVLGADFNNIFNNHYAASGWVYTAVSESIGYTADKRYTQVGYIPMAGFTAMGRITLKF